MKPDKPRELIHTIGPLAVPPASPADRDPVRRLSSALEQERGLTRYLRERLQDATRAIEALTDHLGRLIHLTERQGAGREARAAYGHLGVVSHELRTPLQAVIGYAGILEDQLASRLDEPERAYMDRLQDGLDRIARLVDDLLDFSGMEAGGLHLDRRAVDPVELVRGVLDHLAAPAAEKGVQLTARVDATLPTLLADELRLYQALANLVRNAVKFTPSGGEVFVSAGVADGGFSLTVSDTGVGIAPADQARIFEPFQRVGEEPAEGVGLGLAIARRIAEAHGGAIGLESEPGRGSTFRLWLPLEPPKPGEEVASERVRIVAMAPEPEARAT